MMVQKPVGLLCACSYIRFTLDITRVPFNPGSLSMRMSCNSAHPLDLNKGFEMRLAGGDRNGWVPRDRPMGPPAHGPARCTWLICKAVADEARLGERWKHYELGGWRCRSCRGGGTRILKKVVLHSALKERTAKTVLLAGCARRRHFRWVL